MGGGDWNTRGLLPAHPDGRLGQTHGQGFGRTLHQSASVRVRALPPTTAGRDGAGKLTSPGQVWLAHPSSLKWQPTCVGLTRHPAGQSGAALG